MMSSDGIVLVGLPASGKTTVGRCLAERLGRPFVDVDVEIQRGTGHTPAEHIRRDGEARFRHLERSAVRRALGVSGAVVATGAGAVVEPLNRWDFLEHGMVVWLDVPLGRLAERLRSDPGERPLLAGDISAALSRLVAEREPFYRAADVRVDASEPMAIVADAIGEALQAVSVGSSRLLFDAELPRHHPVGPPTARVVYGRALQPPTLRGVIAGLGSGQPAAVADERVLQAAPTLREAFSSPRLLAVRGGERAKRMRRVETILEWLAEKSVARDDPLAAIGGGTIGDLAGVAAALYLRGIPLVQLPTTWLAQADSAIGGKAAVDLARAKNAAGAFWPASAVIADVGLLRSLPPPRLRDGLAESIKAALIADRALWDLIEARGRGALDGEDEAARYAIIERSIRVKLGIVERDPFEQGERRQLNLGHTLGHALEVMSGYRLSHGAAVAIGMRAVAAIAAARGVCAPELPDRLDALLRELGFRLVTRFDQSALPTVLLADKKRHQGRQHWILPVEIGRVIEVDDVTKAELSAAIMRVQAATG